MLKGICGLALVALVFYSCDGKSQGTGADKGDKKGTILAKVNDKILTYEDLQAQFPSEVRDQLRGADLQEAVETWINTVLVAEKGRQMGLEKYPDVHAAIEFRTADAIARKTLELEIKEKNVVTAAEIDSVYRAEKDSYKLEQNRYRASHILVGTIDEAEAIYNRLQKGDDFAKLAEDYSIDRQSAASGGDIGFFTEDQIDPDFAQAVRGLKDGEISKPVKSNFGFHIIKLTGRQEAGSDIDSLEVKGKISEMLNSNRLGQAYQTYLDSLKKEATIERYPVPELEFHPTPDSK
jgi:foldase protein PrsA